MKINYLKAHNAYQHDDLHIDLVPGVVGIFGNNSSGKSNLVRCIFYGLTGEILGEGSKSEMLKWDEKEGSVTLGVTHDSKSYEVVRGLHKSSHKLLGTEPYDLEKMEDVNNMLSKWIGINVSILESITFVRQGKLDTLLLDQHATRVKTLTKLFGMSDVDKIRTSVLQTINSIPKLYIDESEFLSLKELQKKLDKEVEELKRESEEFDRNLEEQLKNEDALRASLLHPTESYIKSQIEELERKESEYKSVIQKIDGILAVMHPQDPLSYEDIVAASKYERKITLDKKLQEASKQMKEYGALLPIIPNFDQSLLDSIQTSLQGSINFSSNLAEKIKLIKSGMCPTCGRSCDDMEAQLPKLEEEFSKAKLVESSLREEYNTKSVQLSEYTRATNKYGTLYNIAQKTVSEISEELMSIGQVDFDPVKYAKDKAGHDEFLRQKAERDKLQADKKNAENSLSAVSAKKESVMQQTSIPDSMREEVQKVLDMYAGFKKQSAEFKEKLSSKNMECKLTKSRILDIEKAKAKSESCEKVRNVLISVKDAVTYDNLPKITIIKVIDKINKGMEEYLRIFDANFSCFINENLDFCIKNASTDVPRPVHVLSGGQRVVAALSFRFALLQFLSFGCGVLVLDEPTAFLDKEYRETLAEVLGKAASHFSQSNLSVLVPTHDDILKPMCTQYIQL